MNALQDGRTAGPLAPPPELGRWPLLAFMVGRHGRALAGVTAALVITGIAESVGLLALLPLLDVVTGNGAAGASGVGAIVGVAFAAVGLPMTLATLLAFIVAAIVLKSAFWLLAQRHVGYTAARIMTEIRQAMMRSVLRARWTFFAGQPAGIVANAMSTEADRASSTFMAMSNLLAHGVQASLLLGSAFLVNWQISVAAAVCGSLMLLALRRFVVMSRQSGEGITELLRAVLMRVTDGMRSIKSLKSMGQEHRLSDLLARDIDGLNLMHRRLVLAKGAMRAGQDVIVIVVIAGGLYLAIGYAGWSFTELLVTAVLFQRAMVAIGQLQSDYQSMLNTESGLWAGLSLVRAAEAAEDRTGGLPAPALLETVHLDGVAFAHPGTPVLQGVSLTIPANRMTAVIGPSGAGKTTLVDLVCRLLDPDRGRIVVDGTDLAEVDAVAWRQRIGYVPQDTVLFHDSVLRNVTLGDPSIGRDDVLTALRLAGAEDFVSRMPEGVDTVVGEGGSRLSGGQRQRIAIARALARKPRLLILDEATASLDPQTEAEICGTLAGLTGTVTMLAISHRPALMDIADVVYRLEAGRVAELPQAAPARAVANGRAN
ncbi:MAG: ABC transporter ATP-binding protein [Alphaproteobacteria bacterium]